jgi:hypothetical protein
MNLILTFALLFIVQPIILFKKLTKCVKKAMNISKFALSVLPEWVADVTQLADIANVFTHWQSSVD